MKTSDFGANYHIDSVIGQGASGIVYRGHHRRTQQQVAVKILRSDYGQDREIITRFITERDALTSLESPHIVAVQDLIVESGQLGIVMEYVSGTSVRQLLGQEGPLSIPDAVDVTRQVLEGLDVAHRAGIVHRDIKPDNILCSRQAHGSWHIKIADFGIAKILETTTSTTQMVGTPEYMAPELIEHSTVAPSIDIYACGMMLYEMLTGHTAFSGATNAYALARMQVEAVPPTIPSIPETLGTLLDRMLSKDPSKRVEAGALSIECAQIAEQVRGLPALESRHIAATVHPPTILKAASNVVAHEKAAPKSTDLSHSDDSFKHEEHKLSPVPTPQSLRADLKPLDAPSTATVLKPEHFSVTSVKELSQELSLTQPRKWRRSWRKVLGIVIASVMGLLVIGGISWLIRENAGSVGSSNQLLEASVEDAPLPSGLVVERSASYDPQAKKISYTLTLKTSKVALSGDVMEKLAWADGSCSEVTWDEGNQVQPHSKSLTSIDTDCAWTISIEAAVEVSTPVTVTGSIEVAEQALPDQPALEEWLKQVSQQTKTALSDPATTSTAYPLQRLASMKMAVPQRSIQGEPIPVTIIGIWPGGENELAPVAVSTATGEPTSILQAITGGNVAQNYRLVDRCAGAVAVSTDGHSVTALHPATCQLSATVGNFDLDSVSITITSAGS